MPIATTAEQRAGAESLRGWARQANPVATVRAQETAPAAWREHWPALVELGLFGVAATEAAGGLGGTVADLATLLEVAADALVPGPVLGTAVAGAVLTGDLLADVIGGRPVGLGCTPIAAVREAGRLALTGGASDVTDPGADGLLLLPALVDGVEHWAVVPADAPGVKLLGATATDLSRPAVEVHLDRVAPLAELHERGVRELAVTLMAAEAAGVAGWCLRTAVDHATVREQFGRPIGSFQAVKHLCAEMLCRTELAAAVAWDAAEAAGDADQHELSSAVAGAIAFDAAVDTAKDCIQVLGGIGFTFEHDAHLYLRRAVALRALAGGSARWRRRVAELSVAGRRRRLTIDLSAHEAARPGIRSAVDQIAALPEAGRRAALAGSGLLAPHWPPPHGRGASAAEQLLIDQELVRAGVERPDLVIAGWAIPTILAHGSPEQIERFVAPTLRGEIVWCQLFSEPEAGSDLAALRTRAVRAGGGWRLTGQKVWTSLAQQADWAICLARTNPDVPKHKGISYFLVDMRSPGIEIRPLREITGEALFNEVFLDDVFVPDELVVGAVDDGWKLARATLANERVAMGHGSSVGAEVERLLSVTRRDADPLVLDGLGALVANGLAGNLLDLRATVRQLDGRDPGAESSVRKLVGVQHRQAVAEFALDRLGTAGVTDSRELHDFLMTRCLSIAGGTTQVLRSVAAERILGLPRG